MEIIIATGNAGKVREFKRMLEPLGYQVFSQKEKGIILDVEETGTTFAENAVRKAKAVWEKVKLPVIADDSGLCVDALDGRPGIYSARYAGEGWIPSSRPFGFHSDFHPFPAASFPSRWAISSSIKWTLYSLSLLPSSS